MRRLRNLCFACLFSFSLFTVPLVSEETEPEASETAVEEREADPEEMTEESEGPAESEEDESTHMKEETPEETAELILPEESECKEEPVEEPPSETEEVPSGLILNAMEEADYGETDSIDLHETTAHAAARILKQELSEDDSLIQTDSGMLESRGKIASFDSVINEGYTEFIKLYFIHDRPVYCVQPEVNLKLVNGKGGEYQGRTWDSIDTETRTLLKRISYFGYGFEPIGTSNEAYAGTQLLIWKAVSPQYFDSINRSLHMCPGIQAGFSACTVDRSELDSMMSRIMQYVESYDTVPSFTETDGSPKCYSLSWNETLDLEDSKGVLSWFEEDSEESHEGMELEVRDSHLLARITSLSCDGKEQENGKVLTFRRKKEQWENMQNGLLLYEQKDQQKLMAATGEDPVPLYRIALRLKTGDVRILKMDEYGNSRDGMKGTSFVLGWREDPEGRMGPDPDGTSGPSETYGLRYPLCKDNGEIRVFETDADGFVRIEGLPAETEWWLKEITAGEGCQKETSSSLLKVGEDGQCLEYSFVNRLRNLNLEISKQDEETAGEKLNEAAFVIYETGENLNLSKRFLETGLSLRKQEEGPDLSFRQLKEYSSLKEGDRFAFDGWIFEIDEIRGDTFFLTAHRKEDPPSCVFSRYSLPKDLKTGAQRTIVMTEHMHAGNADTEEVLLRVDDIKPADEKTTVKVTWQSAGQKGSQTVDLSEAAPVYSDIPDAARLKEGDTFTLFYPRWNEEGKPETGEQTFRMITNGPHMVKAESEGKEYLIAAPDWISEPDLPEKGYSDRSVQLLSTASSVYEISDSRGNRYRLSKEGTEVLEDSDHAASRDLCWGDLSENGHEAERWKPGETFEKTVMESVSIPYEGVQLADLSEKERLSTAGTVIERKEAQYAVLQNDGISIRIAFVKDGIPYEAELTDAPVSEAYAQIGTEVRFTVESCLPGTIHVLEDDGRSRLLSVSDSSPIVEQYLNWKKEMVPEEAERENFSAEEEHDLRAGDSFERNGRTYAVLEKGEETVLIYPWEEDAPLSPQQIRNLSETMPEWTERKESMPGYTAWKISDGEKTWTYIEERITSDSEHSKSLRMSVRKPSEVLYEEVDAARYGPKKPGQHVSLDGKQYEIVQMRQTESGPEYEIRNKEGTVFRIPDENGLQIPLTIEQIESLPCDLCPGDILFIQKEAYQILQVQTEKGYGQVLQLLRQKDQKRMTVSEHPDPGRMETETILVIRTGEIRNLNPAEGGSYRLRTPNPHVSLQSENGGWTIRSDANTCAVLEERDREGEMTASRRIVFSESEQEGEWNVLPVFAGRTGHPYLRLEGRTRSLLPMAGAEVILYSDEAMRKEVLKKTSDSYGSVDLSELESGTYWYLDPESLEKRTVSVESESLRKGILRMEGLKWGRTYLALETELPDGYDYGNGEAMHLVSLTPEKETETVHKVIGNQLRRLTVSVLKVDQDQHRIPLSNAWFTAEDVTDLEMREKDREDHPDSYPVTLEDIPTGLRAGDTFAVWPDKVNGRRNHWRIETVSEEGAVISLMEDGAFERRFTVPVHGYSEHSPMLYIDIVHAVGTPKEKTVFETVEKEDPSSIRFYRILSMETGPVQDVFGHPTEETGIIRAAVEDITDSSHIPIILKEHDPADPVGNRLIGEYLSGGLIVRKDKEASQLPVSFEQLLAAGIREKGETIRVPMRHIADMPDYGMVRKAADSGRSELTYGIVWNISKEEDGSCWIEAKGQSFWIMKGTRPGAIEWMEEGLLKVISCEKEAGQVKAYTLADPNGNTWFVSGETARKTVRTGRCGVEVTVTSRDSGMVFHGYTGRDGRVVFRDLPDGDYTIESEGTVSAAHTEKGMIFLSSVPYGHLIRICETKSPLGYLRGNACAVLQPMSEYGTDTVTNTRTNKKTTAREEEVRRIVKIRKMGDSIPIRWLIFDEEMNRRMTV